MGAPLKHLGICDVSILSRMLAKRYITKVKPILLPILNTKVCKKLYSLLTFNKAIPKTAQLVVMSGK